MMMISFSPCGCAFNPFTRMIVFCPLHATASLMLIALDQAVQFVAKYANDNDDIIARRMVAKMNIAIAAATKEG